jgi:hypothetical protein
MSLLSFDIVSGNNDSVVSHLFLNAKSRCFQLHCKVASLDLVFQLSSICPHIADEGNATLVALNHQLRPPKPRRS